MAREPGFEPRLSASEAVVLAVGRFPNNVNIISCFALVVNYLFSTLNPGEKTCQSK